MDNLVSVIIPTKNRKELLSKPINSVLQQTIKPLEIIVVDDGSTDGTERFIRDNYPNIILLRNESSVKGAKARNQGASIAKGKYIAFLDSDDYWLENHLENSLHAINSNNADGAFGSFFLDDGIEANEIKFYENYQGGGTLAEKLFSGKLFDARTSTFVFLKSSFDRIKFDENLEKHQDWDLAINFDQFFKFVNYEKSTVSLTTSHSGERMSDKPNHNASFLFIRKNKFLLTADAQFFFSLKRIMHLQKFRQSHQILQNYLHLLDDRLSELSAKNRMLYFLLEKKMLNLYNIYILSKTLRLK